MQKLLFALLFAATSAIAQSPIPFASSNNSIELSVRNSSLLALTNVKVAATGLPAWLHISSKEQIISSLRPQQPGTAKFTFSVDKTAPVNSPQNISFTISSPAGETWTKQIKISVNPPDHFELFQNYPNPFNPTTTISYQLPREGRVAISVFNSIGQLVTTIADGVQPAGYHQEVWNAASTASGMYVYQLVLTNADGKREFYRKKMLLVR